LLQLGDQIPTVTIQSDVSSDSVVQFIEACQLRPYNLTVHNANELDLLCEEWDVPMLRRDIESFMSDSSHEVEILIPNLLFLYHHNKDTSAIEARLRSFVPSLLSSGELLELPFAILSRVLSREWTESEAAGLFEFLLRCLDRIGPVASLLFGAVDLMHLGVGAIEQLRSRRDFR
jgi:hypothetical protein